MNSFKDKIRAISSLLLI